MDQNWVGQIGEMVIFRLTYRFFKSPGTVNWAIWKKTVLLITTNVLTGQPDDFQEDSQQDCAVMVSKRDSENGKWYDVSCFSAKSPSTGHKFIPFCERDKSRCE